MRGCRYGKKLIIIIIIINIIIMIIIISSHLKGAYREDKILYLYLFYWKV